jgi:hypothetical protein
MAQRTCENRNSGLAAAKASRAKAISIVSLTIYLVHLLNGSEWTFLMLVMMISVGGQCPAPLVAGYSAPTPPPQQGLCRHAIGRAPPCLSFHRFVENLDPSVSCDPPTLGHLSSEPARAN